MAKFGEIEKFLKREGINFKVINLPAAAVSVEDVIRLSGGQIKEEEIIKTLIGKNKDGEFMAFILRGRDRLKPGAVERLATREEVAKIAGVEVGAVCPILIGITVVIDKKVRQLKRVNMGSGDHLKGLEMDFGDLLKVLPAHRIEEIT